MPKSLTSATESHVDGEVTTLATCWEVTRTDGVVFRLTDHDVDLTVGNNNYTASSGYQRTAVESNSDLQADNLELMGLFSNDHISEEELRLGLFDYADVRIFLVNWQDPSQGIIRTKRGRLGEVTLHSQGFYKAEFRSMAQQLEQSVNQVYQPLCRADLGDSKCKVPLSPDTPTRDTQYREERVEQAVLSPGTGVSGSAQTTDYVGSDFVSAPNLFPNRATLNVVNGSFTLLDAGFGTTYVGGRSDTDGELFGWEPFLSNFFAEVNLPGNSTLAPFMDGAFLSRCFSGDDSVKTLQQRISIANTDLTSVDNGDVDLYFYAYRATGEDNSGNTDRDGRVRVEALDASESPISTLYTSGRETFANDGAWRERSAEGVSVPTNTRFIQIAFDVRKGDGADEVRECLDYVHGYLDDTSVEPNASDLGFTNLGFETGDLTGWTAESGSFSLEQSNGGVSAHTGDWYLAWSVSGPGTLVQEHSVPSFLTSEIDNENTLVDLSFWRSNPYSGDTGRFRLIAKDSGGSEIETMLDTGAEVISPLDTWVERGQDDIQVPANTRSIEMRYEIIVVDGSNGNAALDSIDFILRKKETLGPIELDSVSLDIVNQGFETGDLTGWTVELGTFDVLSSHGGMNAQSGEFFLARTVGGDGRLTQHVPTPSGFETPIDTGDASFNLSFWRANSFIDDTGRLRAVAEDSGGNVLGVIYDSGAEEITPEDSWVSRSGNGAVPPNTRMIRLQYDVAVVDGSNGDASLDNVRMSFQRSSQPPDTTLAELGFQNGSFETGDTTGWTLFGGASNVQIESAGNPGERTVFMTPYSGEFYLFRLVPRSGGIQQDVELPSEYHAAIDAGSINYIFRYAQTQVNVGDGDSHNVLTRALDGDDNFLADLESQGPLRETDSAYLNLGQWRLQVEHYRLPVNTRKLRIMIVATGESSDSLADVGVDAVSGDLQSNLGSDKIYECLRPGTTASKFIPGYTNRTGDLVTDGSATFVAREAWVRRFEVTEVIEDRRVFKIAVADRRADNDNQWFVGGMVTWDMGDNEGLRLEVKSWGSSSRDVELFLRTTYPIQVGDRGRITAGCLKRFEQDCVQKFDNALNFRGEPHMPKDDAHAQYPS